MDAGDLARAIEMSMWTRATSPARSEMERIYNYRRNLPHIQKDRRPLFVTFNTNGKWALPEAAREIALKCCVFQNGKMAELHAAVVMPDHVHLILTPRLDARMETYSLAEILQNIKSVSAHRINRSLHRSGRVWQEESFDHVIRLEEALEEKVEYLCSNPVRRGLVGHPAEYRWLWVNPGICCAALEAFAGESPASTS